MANLIMRVNRNYSGVSGHHITRLNKFASPRLRSAFLFLLVLLLFSLAPAQDWVELVINKGAPIRLAVPDFKAAGTDAQTASLNTVFNQTLWSDLDNSGVFEMVGKSFYPLSTPGSPNDIKLDAWSNAPVNAAFVAFGNLG